MSIDVEQLAKQWLKNNLPEGGEDAEIGFLAGYQAAKDQLADADKVMNSPEKPDSCEHILDMEKMVDVNSSNNSNGWISVKERLPETNELCIVNTEWRGIVPATYGNESWIFDEGQGWSEKPLSYASHWMPLPEPPKEEKLITSLDQIHRPQKRISVEELREMFPDKPPKEEK